MSRFLTDPQVAILEKKRGIEYHTTLAVYPNDVMLADKAPLYWASVPLEIGGTKYAPLLLKDGSIVSALSQSSDRYEAQILPTEELRVYLRENAEKLQNAEAELGIWLKDLHSGLIEHRIVFRGLFSSINIRRDRANLPILSTVYANKIGVEALESLCTFRANPHGDPRCASTSALRTCNGRYNDADGCDGHWGSAKASKFGGIGPGTVDAVTLAPQTYTLAKNQAVIDAIEEYHPQQTQIQYASSIIQNDSTNKITKVITPTNRYDAITDLGMSGDPRLYETTSVIPSGATSFTLSGTTKEAVNGIIDGDPLSVYPQKFKVNETHTFRVGQGIRIPDGKAANVDLVATITVVNGNTITFSPATTNANAIDFVQHDDTAALQDFLDTYIEGHIEFPEGYYPISSFESWATGKDYAIAIPATSEALNRQFVFQGKGRYRSGFIHTGPGHAFKLGGTTTNNLVVRGLYIGHANKYQLQTLNSVDSGVALYLASNQYTTEGVPQSGATACLIEDNLFIGWKWGIFSDNMQSSVVRNNSFYYCNNSIALVATGNVRGIGSQTEPNANQFDENFIQYAPVLASGTRRSVTDAVTTAAHDTGGASTGHNASNVVTSATAAFASTDLYRVVKIAGASVNQTDHFALITEVTSSTAIKLSQAPWIESTGLTLTLYPRSLAHMYFQNASNISIYGGTWQGNWVGQNAEVYGLLAENLDEIQVSALWQEDNGGGGGSAQRYTNVRGIRISGSNCGANGGTDGYGSGIYLDGVTGCHIDGCYIGSSGTGVDIEYRNGTRGVLIDNTTLTAATNVVDGNTGDTTANFWPVRLGSGVRFLNGGGTDGAYSNELLRDSLYARNALVNGNFQDGLTGWTQDVPAALAATNTGTARGLRYITITPSTAGGGAYSTQLSQSYTIPDSVQLYQPMVLGFDYYIQDRGADAIGSAPYYNEMRVKLVYSDGTTYQLTVNPSASNGRIEDRWNRGQILARVPDSASGRTVGVRFECATGSNAAIFRVSNVRLTYGMHATYDDDEVITELNGGTLFAPLLMREQSSVSTPAANTIAVYAKDNAGTTKLYIKDSAGTETDVTGSAGSSAVWSSLTDPSTDLALSMGTNHTALTWGTPSSGNMFQLSDGNSTTTGSVLRIYTGATSTAKPVTCTAQGTANGVEMDTSGNLQAIGTGNVIATKVLSSAGAAPTISATIAYDSTSHTLEYGANGANRMVANLDEAQTFTNKTLTTPTIASFANAGHNHTNSAGGGQLTDAALSSAVGVAKGGTGATTASAGFNALSPMTTLGDVIYGDASGAGTRLAGNTTATKKFLRQTGNGTISAAPAWDTVAASDISGSALTKTDDTNVTMTLGGSASTALLNAASITLGWTGTLAKARQHSATVYNDAANTWSTGAQDFSAATSLKVPVAAGAAPTTSGLVAYDSTTNTLEYGMNGTNRVLPVCFYALPTVKYFDNSATETTLFDSNPTIPANWFDVGRMLEIKLRGLVTTAGTPPTVRIKVKLGTTIIADSGAITMTDISAQARTFDVSATLRCEATGNPGTFYASGFFGYQTGDKTKDSIEILNQGNGVNTAANQTLSVTAQFGTGSASNSFEVQSAWVVGYAN